VSAKHKAPESQGIGKRAGCCAWARSGCAGWRISRWISWGVSKRLAFALLLAHNRLESLADVAEAALAPATGGRIPLGTPANNRRSGAIQTAFSSCGPGRFPRARFGVRPHPAGAASARKARGFVCTPTAFCVRIGPRPGPTPGRPVGEQCAFCSSPPSPCPCSRPTACCAGWPS